MTATIDHRSSLDADMVEMLRSSLAHVLTEETDRPLAERLAELGWSEVVEQDAATALGLLFAVKGETRSTADALGAALAAELAEVADDPSLAAVTVGFPSPYTTSTAAPDSSADEILVDVVVDRTPGDLVAVTIDARVALVHAAELTASPLGGTDQSLGLVRLTGSARPQRWIDDAGARLTATARWLLACELTAIGRAVADLAIEYTKERIQYGKPIGVFQALQHRLAAAHAMVVGAGHLAAEAGRDRSSWTATVAKCMAGHSAEFACTQAQQCFGAIGFTWEHEFPHYLRRVYVLDRLFGDWRSLEHEIGSTLVESGTVPRIGSL